MALGAWWAAPPPPCPCPGQGRSHTSEQLPGWRERPDVNTARRPKTLPDGTRSLTRKLRSSPRPSTRTHAGRCRGSKAQVSETASASPHPAPGTRFRASRGSQTGQRQGGTRRQSQLGRRDPATNAAGRGARAALRAAAVVLPRWHLQLQENAWRTAGAQQLCPARDPPPVGSRLCPLPRLLRVSLALLRPACPPPPDWRGAGPASLGFTPLPPARLSNQMARNEVEGLLARHALGLGHLALADASVSRAPLQPREGGVLTEKPTEQRLTVPSDRTPGTHHLGCPREPRTASGPPAGARAGPGGGR